MRVRLPAASRARIVDRGVRDHAARHHLFGHEAPHQPELRLAVQLAGQRELGLAGEPRVLALLARLDRVQSRSRSAIQTGASGGSTISLWTTPRFFEKSNAWPSSPASSAPAL